MRIDRQCNLFTNCKFRLKCEVKFKEITASIQIFVPARLWVVSGGC